MKVFLTGSTGFIGRNLLQKLSVKYQVFSPSHKQLNLLDTKAVEKYLRKNRFDIVIHCAVVGGSQPQEHVENALSQNLKIFFNIIRNNTHFGKIINCGSGAEYDKSRPLNKIKEDDFDKKVPTDDYGLFKYLCSKHIEKLDNAINLRIFGLFGKFEDYRYRFISNAICKNIFGLPITIKRDVYFDYLYIDDFIKIIDYFINHIGEYKFYNVGSGKPINILTIAKRINQMAKKKSKIIIKSKGLNNEYTCDNLRLIKELKYFGFTSFDISLKKLYSWYERNQATILKNEL